MISVEEATRIIQSNLYKPDVITVPLEQAVGAVLAGTVVADRDFPPFDRASMDGIAVSAEAYVSGRRQFAVEGMQPAGVPQKRLSDPARCLEVMTGAVVPEGADLVIRYEDVTINDGMATVNTDDYIPAQNIHRKGADVREGDVLLLPGTFLSPAEIALLASVGESQVKIRRQPRTAVISTGDELVDIRVKPDNHQVRRSNSYALAAALQQAGIVPDVHHLPDSEDMLRDGLSQIMAKNELVIVTGGVSRGKFDFVPAILEELGVKRHFHGVAQRPGKPFWFGTTSDGKSCFALPGNPVSTYMCFYRYVRPWLRASLGVPLRGLTAILSEEFTFLPTLTYFLQVRVDIDAGRLIAQPVPGGGSGDFANLGQVDGFLELPPESSLFAAGEAFPFVPFRLVE
ncbi:MAG TPA: gephyrin-like molybdotransferase Glp [Cyclobacteriaceae bacterium]